MNHLFRANSDHERMSFPRQWTGTGTLCNTARSTLKEDM